MESFTILSAVEQVAGHLQKELLRGSLSGTMPGVGPLAEELGVNHKTVRAALRQLEDKGLLMGQGSGLQRRIMLPPDHAPSALRVGFLNSERIGQDYMVELRHLLEKAGHSPFYPSMTLQDLGMDANRVARFARRTKADAWVVISGSREVLEWFAEQETPAFALFGHRAGLPIAGIGPDKIHVTAEVTRRLIALGHRRVSALYRRQVRLPKPARSLRAFLDELEAAGIATGKFNIPDWEESKEGFERALDSLFGPTPPTTLILDEAYLYYAAYHYLARRGLRVPQDVSLVCTDDDPGFIWCQPSVAHFHWDRRPVMRRIVSWTSNVARGEDDRRQSLTKARFVEGETISRHLKKPPP
ncbi:MAG: substrate-binding domain-containing protein [Verrucomicrobiales bacterium]|jgi:DNA-binding LacI/PurR family transcriptional regulator